MEYKMEYKMEGKWREIAPRSVNAATAASQPFAP